MSYLGDLNALIDDKVQERESFIADEIASELEAESPDVVKGWLDECAASILRAFIQDRLRRDRGVRQSRRKSRLSIFDWTFVVGEDFTRKRLGAMTGADHLFVARDYADGAKRARVHESIHRAIAKKVGDRRTDEVFSEDQLASLFGFEADKPKQENVA